MLGCAPNADRQTKQDVTQCCQYDQPDQRWCNQYILIAYGQI